jgi:hypothetical protein
MAGDENATPGRLVQTVRVMVEMPSKTALSRNLVMGFVKSGWGKTGETGKANWFVSSAGFVLALRVRHVPTTMFVAKRFVFVGDEPGQGFCVHPHRFVPSSHFSFGRATNERKKGAERGIGSEEDTDDSE